MWGKKKWQLVAMVVLALAALWYFRGDEDDAPDGGLVGVMSSGFAAAKGIISPSKDPCSTETDRLIADISTKQQKATGVPASSI